jgi:hypothetical protein
VEGSCEHGNEPSGSVKCLEILEWLSHWRLLQKDSAPQSYLCVFCVIVPECSNFAAFLNDLYTGKLSLHYVFLLHSGDETWT